MTDDLKAADASEIESLRKRLAHTEEWYAVRFRRLFDWAHSELSDDQRNRYFSIVANGSATPFEPDNYTALLNLEKHRANRAEQDVLTLKAATRAAIAYVVATGPCDNADDDFAEGYPCGAGECSYCDLCRAVDLVKEPGQ